MYTTEAFTGCVSALSCMAAEDKFRAYALHLFYPGLLFTKVSVNAAADIQSFAKVSDHVKNMSIRQVKLIIASSTMTKHMYTF